MKARHAFGYAVSSQAELESLGIWPHRPPFDKLKANQRKALEEGGSKMGLSGSEYYSLLTKRIKIRK